MKKTMMKILLVLVPFMAVVLATTNDSVRLVDMTTGEKVVGSYFAMLSEDPVAVCPSLAGTCGIVSLASAILYLIVKKRGFLKTSEWAAFAGACLAVIPVAARGDHLLLPNVFYPILLMIHFLVAAFSPNWNLEKKDLPQGRRLEQHH